MDQVGNRHRFSFRLATPPLFGGKDIYFYTFGNAGSLGTFVLNVIEICGSSGLSVIYFLTLSLVFTKRALITLPGGF